MLNRPLHPKQRTVMLINDIPVKKEVEQEEKFTAPSNMNLLTSLRTGKVYAGEPIPGHKGILSTDIFTTYLDYSPYEEGNYDFKNDFAKRKDLTYLNIAEDIAILVHKTYEFVKGEDVLQYQWFPVPHQKDLYISHRLLTQLEALINEIKIVQPKFIIVTGKWSLFFLTACTTFGTNMGTYKDKKPFGGLTKFRSSILQPHECWELNYIEDNLPPIVMPIYHPVNANNMPDKIPIMELDLQKIGWMYHVILEKGVSYYLKPEKIYHISLDKDFILNYLDELLKRLDIEKHKVSIDIETMFYSIIDCIGITDSIDEGICIPFASIDNPNLWSKEDEIELLCKIREILIHPNTIHVGQNYQFDCQYFYWLWGLNINVNEDTMIKHHIIYNTRPKDLASLASLYCEFYSYWKYEIEATKETPEDRWKYNVKDVCYTLEINNVLDEILLSDPDYEKLNSLYRFQIDRLSPLLVNMMNRGVKIDVVKKQEYFEYFSKIMLDIEQAINDMLGFDFNIRSHIQKKKVFSDFLGITLKIKRGRGTETCDAKAMLEYMEEYPIYKPFLGLLLEYNAIKTFTTNFLGMLLDKDDRARTQYKIAGTATGRLASTKNVRNTGGNLQNIPEKGKIPLVYTLELLQLNESKDIEEEMDWNNYIENLIMAEEDEE